MNFDIENFRIPDTSCPPPKVRKKRVKIGSSKEKFIMGPLPVSWLVRAGELPGDYTLRTALALFYVQGMEGGRKIVLERYHLDQFKIGKDSARRALQRLEQAGLIELGKKGRKFAVTIIPVGNGGENDHTDE